MRGVIGPSASTQWEKERPLGLYVAKTMNRLSRIREAIPLSPKFVAPALTFIERHSRGWRSPAPSQFVEDLLLARGQGPVCRCQVKDGAGPGQCLDVDGRDPKT